MKKRYFLLPALLCLMLNTREASAGPRAVLKGDDVQHFIRTFPGMYRRWEQLGFSFNPKTGTVAGVHRVRAQKEVRKILEDQGWNWTFWPKMHVIVRGYAVLRYGKDEKRHDTNIGKAISDIERNPWIKPEQKRELIQKIRQGQKDIKAVAATSRKGVNEKDLARIKPHLGGLKTVLEPIRARIK